MVRRAAVALLLLFFPSLAEACMCSGGTGCPQPGNKSQPLFVGTVLSLTDVALPADGTFRFLESRKVRLRVEQAFGEVPAAEIELWTDLGGGDCGYPFTVGASYLVDAASGKDGKLHTSICSGTRRLQHAGPELRVLHRLAKEQPRPALVGRLIEEERTFHGRLDSREARALSATVVRLQGPGGATDVYEATTDEDGIFEFASLPRAEYSVSAGLPKGLVLSTWLGSDEPPRSIRAGGGGCTIENLQAMTSGSIAGRVLDAATGVPVPEALVYLLPESMALPEARTDAPWESQERGAFRFVHVPPGRYRLFVNLEDKRQPGFPYPRTSTEVITVGPGEQVRDVELRLKKNAGVRSLRVQVTWADGRTVRDWVHVEAKPLDPESDAGAETKQPDLKLAIADMQLVEGVGYGVQAKIVCRYSTALSLERGLAVKSDRVTVTPGDGRKEIVLRLGAGGCPQVPGKTLETERHPEP